MRRVLKALLILAIGLPVLAAAGYWYLQQQIAQAGITNVQLDFRRFTAASASLHRVRFNLQQDDAMYQFDLQNVSIRWQWQQAFTPTLQRIDVGTGQIVLARRAGQLPQNNNVAFSLPSQWQLPGWLPRHVNITDTNLLFPCATGQCQLQLKGYLTYHNQTAANEQADASWQSQLIISNTLLNIEQGLSELVIDAHYQATPQPALELTVQQQQQLGLSLKQQINLDSQLAVTELAVALSPPSPANQALLKQWGFSLPDAWLAQFQQPVQLYSRLSWQLPADGDLSNLLRSHDIDGMVTVRAPDPFFLPQLGLIQGELSAVLSLKNQIVERWQLKANGRVSGLVLPAAVTEYGLWLNPLQFSLSSKATETLNLTALPLQLQLSSRGDNNFNLNSELTVKLNSSLRVDINQLNLSAAVAKLSLPDNTVTLTNLQFDTKLSGHWQASNWQLALANSDVSGAIQATDFSAGNIKLTANHSHFTGDQAGLTEFNSNLNASISKLNQSALLSQTWQWQSQLNGNPAKFALDGQLANDAGLAINHQLTYQPATGNLALNWQLPEIFLLAANPVAATLSDWPALLTLNKGKLTANGHLNINDGDINSSNQLQLGDLGGIYDRSLFAGLNATVDIVLNNNQLQLQSNNFKLNRLNHGFEVGPLTLIAKATLPLAAPEQIKLSLQLAELQVMAGTISANNQQLDFSQPENQLRLQLQQIDLASLLQQHPSSDFTGNGKLSGTVPLTISAKGLSVTDGSIAAEAPGGSLQYRSASTSAMAQTNSNMKLVFDALEDFHYSVLNSDISYNTSGKLILGLQLQGSNPKIQQGRAINLNVNLEEDLPALITSLQLTNKLNDVITQRVQQYLKQQAAAAANGEKP